MNISKLKGVFATAVAAIGLAAVAANVEITSVTQTPGSGKATVNYAVSGLSTKTDLAIKASANGKSTDTTIAGVANGAGSVTIDYKTALGAAPNVAFSAVLTDPDTEGVQLWADGPYWATCNVGASKPEDSGYHFWWGDTVGYAYATNSVAGKWQWDAVLSTGTVSFGGASGPSLKTYNQTVDQLKTGGYLDANGNLVAAHDAATAHLGAPWRMPTSADFAGLNSNCTRAYVSNWNETGVNGWLVTGTGDYASKSIFLPAAGFGNGDASRNPNSQGFYWSSASAADSQKAYRVYFYWNSTKFDFGGDHRYYGATVRAVRSCAK